jgi:hypothetical protein
MQMFFHVFPKLEVYVFPRFSVMEARTHVGRGWRVSHFRLSTSNRLRTQLTLHVFVRL